MKHKSEIEKYNGSMNELAEDIGNLRYDALAVFLQLLYDKIVIDGTMDKKRNREKLSVCLENCSKALNLAKSEIDKAWMICKPYTL